MLTVPHRLATAVERVLQALRAALRRAPAVPPAAAGWLAAVDRAAAVGDRTALRRLVSAAPADAPGALRAALVPIRQMGDPWSEVRVWRLILGDGTPPQRREVGAALRAAVNAATQAPHRAPASVAGRRALLGPLLRAGAGLDDPGWRVAADLLAAAAFVTDAPRDALSQAALRTALHALDGRRLAALAGASSGIGVAWLRAALRHFMRERRFVDAERVLMALKAHSPGHPGLGAQLLDLLLRRGRHRRVLAAILQGEADSLTLAEAASVFKRLRPVQSVLIGRVADLSTPALVRMWLAMLPWRSSRRLHGAVLTELRRRPEAEVVAAAAGVAAAEARPLTDLAALAQSLAAALDAQAPDQAPEVARWAELLAQGAVAEAAAFAGDWRRPLVEGLHRFDDLGWTAPRCAPPSEDGFDALLSFRPVSSQTLRRHPVLRAVPREIRIGRRGAREDVGRVATAKEIEAAPNSQTDFDSARLSARAAKLALSLMATPPQTPEQALFVDEVLALAADDRLYSGVKTRRSILDHMAASGVRRVAVVACTGRVLAGLELAWLLSTEGFEVHLGFDALTAEERRSLVAVWSAGVENGADIVLNYARRTLGPGPADPLDVAACWGADPTVPVAVAGAGAGTLIVASLGDPLYATAAQALRRALGALGETLVYNGGSGGSEAFAAASGAPVLSAAPDAAEKAGIEAAVDAALRHLLDRLRAPAEGTAEGDAAARLWLVANATRLTHALRIGLIAELSHLRELRALFAGGGFAAVATAPGRMTSARTATLLARRHGRPSVDVQAFFISDHPRYLPSLADAYGGITSDQIEVYRRKNPPPTQRIVRIGSLMIDERLARVRALSAERARAQAGVAPHQRLILYCAQHGEGQEGDDTMRLMARAARTVPRSVLIVKLHPRVAPEAIEEARRSLRDEAGVDLRIQRDGDIYALMRAADLVVTRFSNVGLEAAVMGAPVLSVNLSGKDYIVDLAGFGVAALASTEAEVIGQVHALLDDPAAREALRVSRDAYFARNPELRGGAAAETVTQMLREALAGR